MRHDDITSGWLWAQPARAASGSTLTTRGSLGIALRSRSAIPDNTRGRRGKPDAAARRQISQAMSSGRGAPDTGQARDKTHN